MIKKRTYFTPVLPRNRQVVGPQGDCGIIAKAAGHGKKRLEILDERRQRNQSNRDRARLRSQFEREAYLSSFWSSADVRGAVSRIRRFVDKGLEAADDDLNLKRNRVKAILLEEEAALTQEYVDKAQRSADLEFEMKKKCAEEIENRQANQEKAFVDDAYNRIFENSNDEFRASRSAKLRKELNKIHKLQMRDKELEKLKEEEETNMWLAVMDKEQKAKSHREESEMKQRNLNFEKNTEILRKQIFGIKLQRENEANLKREEMEFWRKVKKDSEEEAQLFQVDQKEEEGSYWNALKEQLEMNKHQKRRLEQEEKNIDKLIFDYNSAILKDEQEQVVDDREKERMEQHLFRESMRQFKVAMNRLENESEDFITKENAEKLAIKKESKKKANAIRKEFYLACSQNRERQVEMKRLERAQMARNEELLWKAGVERLTLHANLEKAQLSEKEQSTATRMTSINDEQVSYKNLLTERAEQEDREFLEGLRQSHGKDIEKGKALLTNPRPGILHPVITQHRAKLDNFDDQRE